jgi:hypothetical protein
MALYEKNVDFIPHSINLTKFEQVRKVLWDL